MANQGIPNSPQEFLKSLNILHLALLGGQVMIFVVLYFALDTSSESENSSMVVGGIDEIAIAFMTFFVLAVGASFFLFNKRKEEGKNLKGTLMDKLSHYRSSFVLRAALLEGANLSMLLIYFFVSKNIVLLILFAIGAALFLMIRPTASRIIEDYQLSHGEQSQLRPSLF